MNRYEILCLLRELFENAKVVEHHLAKEENNWKATKTISLDYESLWKNIEKEITKEIRTYPV